MKRRLSQCHALSEPVNIFTSSYSPVTLSEAKGLGVGPSCFFLLLSEILRRPDFIVTPQDDIFKKAICREHRNREPYLP